MKKISAPELQKFVQLWFLSSGAAVYFSILEGSAPELEKNIFLLQLELRSWSLFLILESSAPEPKNIYFRSSGSRAAYIFWAAGLRTLFFIQHDIFYLGPQFLNSLKVLTRQKFQLAKIFNSLKSFNSEKFSTWQKFQISKIFNLSKLLICQKFQLKKVFNSWQNGPKSVVKRIGAAKMMIGQKF